MQHEAKLHKTRSPAVSGLIVYNISMLNRPFYPSVL